MNFFRKFVAPLGYYFVILLYCYIVILLYYSILEILTYSFHDRLADPPTYPRIELSKYCTMDKAEKKASPKQEEGGDLLKVILADGEMSDELKVHFVSGAMQKAMEAGDNSMLDLTSPTTKKLAKYMAATELLIPSPQKPEVRRKLVFDWKRKKDTQLSQQKQAKESVPEHKVRQQVLKPTPPVAKHSNEAHMKSEQCDAKPAAKKLDEEVFSSLAQAQDSLGATALLKKTEPAVEGKPNTKYFICNGKNCKLRWRIESPNDLLDSSPARVYCDSTLIHTCIKSTSWLAHYEHLCLHKHQQPSCIHCQTFMRRRGLPKLIQAWIDNYMNQNPTKPPADIGRQYLKEHQNTNLLKNDAAIRNKVKEQISTYVRKNRVNVAPTETTRMKYFDDLLKYITRYRIKLYLVKKVYDIPKPINEEWVRQFAVTLWSTAIIQPYGCGSDADLQTMHRKLVTLHHESVGSNDRYQHLVEAREGEHKTGPDPLNRTLVFTSIALLCNVIYVMQSGWPSTVGIDGTHEVAKTEYKLLPFGYFVMKGDGTRTFYPVAYAFGEGEREVCALHLFLNINSALKLLFGFDVMPLDGGCVSDHTAVFANSVKHAFGHILLMQCYPHIIRKFLEPKQIGGREGNGDYYKHCTTNDRTWFHKVALNDVRSLHRCRTLEQFSALWKLVKEAWTEKGESAMALTFEGSYIVDDRYNKWRYNVSGIYGCIPCNQPLEAHNKHLKGSSEIEGLMKQGRSFLNSCTTEFPKLVEICSLEKTGPILIEPILDVQMAVRDNKFMEYYDELVPEVDVFWNGDGWLINDLDHLNKDITKDDIKNLELALTGKLIVGLESRDELVYYTDRFHHVTTTFIGSGLDGRQVCYRCTCKNYYSSKRCYPSMYIQHRGYLKTKGEAIPGAKKKKKKTASQQHWTAIQKVKKRKQEREGK